MKQNAIKMLHAVFKACQRLGQVKATYNPGLVLCDYDHSHPPGIPEVMARLRVCRLSPVFLRYDKTQHGFHIVLKVKEPLGPWETLALQAILGSDPRREAMNWFRLANTPGTKQAEKHWNILYERKIYVRPNRVGNGSGRAHPRGSHKATSHR